MRSLMEAIRETNEAWAFELALWRIRRSPAYRQAITWGSPRPGHPEGTIARHIEELESLTAAIPEPMSRRELARLRLLIHVHDTFKGNARRGAAILDPDSHASLARVFLAQYCGDRDLLAMTQFHDMPYSLYRNGRTRAARGEERMRMLAARIRDWSLFARFLSLDSSTSGKDGAWLRPFFSDMRAYADLPLWCTDEPRVEP